MHMQRAAEEVAMRLSLRLRWAVLVIAAGGFAVAYACSSLVVGLIWSNGLARYPGAGPLGTARLRLDTLSSGYVSQHDAYQSADDLPKVFGWYARHFSLGHDEAQSENCLAMTRVAARLLLEHWLSVTLCSHPGRTLIFVNRSLALRW
jgi:hypothetical protein